MGVQPRLREPILFDDDVPGVEWKLGTGIRIGSLVEFKGQPRFVLDIRKKTVDVPGRPCFPEDAFEVCPQLPIKMTAVEVRIAEGFVPMSQVELRRI